MVPAPPGATAGSPCSGTAAGPAAVAAITGTTAVGAPTGGADGAAGSTFTAATGAPGAHDATAGAAWGAGAGAAAATVCGSAVHETGTAGGAVMTAGGTAADAGVAHGTAVSAAVGAAVVAAVRGAAVPTGAPAAVGTAAGVGAPAANGPAHGPAANGVANAGVTNGEAWCDAEGAVAAPAGMATGATAPVAGIVHCGVAAGSVTHGATCPAATPADIPAAGGTAIPAGIPAGLAAAAGTTVKAGIPAPAKGPPLGATTPPAMPAAMPVGVSTPAMPAAMPVGVSTPAVAIVGPAGCVSVGLKWGCPAPDAGPAVIWCVIAAPSRAACAMSLTGPQLRFPGVDPWRRPFSTRRRRLRRSASLSLGLTSPSSGWASTHSMVRTLRNTRACTGAPLPPPPRISCQYTALSASHSSSTVSVSLTAPDRSIVCWLRRRRLTCGSEKLLDDAVAVLPPRDDVSAISLGSLVWTHTQRGKVGGGGGESVNKAKRAHPDAGQRRGRGPWECGVESRRLGVIARGAGGWA